MNDPYVLLAKKQGYKSRSAYKLIEIDNKFKIFKKGYYVLDLGSSPGGWTQVAAHKVASDDKSYVIAVDINHMDPIPNTKFINCDIINNTRLVYDALQDMKFNIVLSDLAPKSCGHKYIDHANIMNLCEIALNIANNFLLAEGIFVTKILQGEYEKEFYQKMKHSFKKVKYFKPNASRKNSPEMYLIGLGYLHKCL
ncbi:RlmE family RNA methyltransferase [Neoehrlichia mikurensis]|uniref:Ribosomal RNA large subunit methyltransferase E n=1 Tax=Neoehrlichia mikurensis TaxID=89586 RepID=A0A9Q9BUS6_9RICK|nr:RlmE family RNA methyltransferase [Neoehrlichia mikurensis]QXK92426.1 RlmE family RNA methyltransferase [Neoehrlichia mikurensis]QXK93272.1 RlmE family RNA methyltransferase [Neoehrlichia mikurensis]QXK94116.1 RlmE family RNA methyltransferase [Neoehrlichia mikurensis]UTO55972.1 RlmE family RNA methyltransferase [Neoehrlichia mikurensis]UTO56888.1 RlmE family RNA methyltransferase [Neoehrlichia mikurensis]